MVDREGDLLVEVQVCHSDFPETGYEYLLTAPITYALGCTGWQDPHQHGRR